MAQSANLKVVLKYARDAASGKSIVGREIALACKRFLADYSGKTGYVLKPEDPEKVIKIIEGLIKHREGRDPVTNEPFLGKPFKLQPWQKFIIYNILGIYDKKTGAARYRTCWVMIPRKSGKTPYVAALAFALSILRYRAGGTVYIAAASLKQALESFKFLQWNIEQMGEAKNFRIRDNAMEHSIFRDFGDGFISINALACSPGLTDSFKAPVVIVDEVHALKSGDMYDRLSEATLAYGTSGLTIAITTAGDNQNSFCYRKNEYAVKVLEGTVRDDSLFAFISRADMDPDTGEIKYTDPVQIQKANPSWGVTISPQVLIDKALAAQNDPDARKSFISRNLCRYVASMKQYFDLDKVRLSDQRYCWTIDELAKMKITWYGGVDLSRQYDLTAAVLFGVLHNYTRPDGTKTDVNIVIPHCWFPRTEAHEKAEKDSIPLFGWEDSGWLTMCNSPTVNHSDVIRWFREMKAKGFKISKIGFDPKFSAEFFVECKKYFKIQAQTQAYWIMSSGFRHTENAILNKTLYYCHSEAYEYCIGNVRAIEDANDLIRYSKMDDTARMDIFDSSVMAIVQYLDSLKQNKGWWDSKNGTVPKETKTE